jgi:transcriptional regulator with XRE-family HTH domain
MSYARRGQAERNFDALVGARIARARKARGVSTVKLALVLGIPRNRLYWIEAGGRCSLYLAVEIAAALGAGLAEFLPNRFSAEFSSNEKNGRFVRAPAVRRLG